MMPNFLTAWLKGRKRKIEEKQNIQLIIKQESTAIWSLSSKLHRTDFQGPYQIELDPGGLVFITKKGV